jgi:hypothetical protein
MVKSLFVRVFTCIEYGIAILFAVSLAFMLTQGLGSLVPQIYDYSSEQDLVGALREGYGTDEITHLESKEVLQIYRDNQPEFRLERWRIRLLYTVSICVSAVVMMLLFKKYRSLRFRERLRDCFSTAPKP